MATIQDLIQLNLKKVKNPALKETITEILDNHKKAEDKADFLKVFQPNIDKAYLLTSKYAPDAIEKDVKKAVASEPSKVKKEQPKKEKPKVKPKSIPETKSKLSSAEFQDLRKEIDDKLDDCRAMIRKDNKEKRALLPPKRPQSTYEKVQKKVLSLGKLIPSNLKNSLEIQKQTKKILMKAHKDILNAWRMNSLKKLEKDQQLIKEQYEEIEDKIKGE